RVRRRRAAWRAKALYWVWRQVYERRQPEYATVPAPYSGRGGRARLEGGRGDSKERRRPPSLAAAGIRRASSGGAQGNAARLPQSYRPRDRSGGEARRQARRVALQPRAIAAAAVSHAAAIPCPAR